MGGPQEQTTRWRLLKILHAADAPLDCAELAEQAGIAKSTVRQGLIRPARARWVAVDTVLAMDGNPTHKYIYSITDLGRRVLADHLKEKESS